KKNFTSMIDFDTSIDKVSRLNVLAQAYLPNKNNIKSQSLIIADLFYSMYFHIYSNGNLDTRKSYSIIPNPYEMHALITELENHIILEMQLGYKTIRGNEHLNYYKQQFQKDLSF